MQIKKLPFNIILWLDYTLNLLTLGYVRETVSARAYRRKWVIGQKIINSIFFDRSHCYNAYLNIKYATDLPEEYRCIKPAPRGYQSQ